MANTANVVQLKPRTLAAFEAYVREAEAAMEPSQRGRAAFLWSETDSDRVQQVRQGNTATQALSKDSAFKVPNGLIHDWIGATFAPGATVQQTLDLIQNYDSHKTIYQPDVMDSSLITRKGNDFQIYLRLLKKKIVTVVLDTYHDVHYSSVDEARWLCRSYTTRICEVEDAGTAKEIVLAADSGYGFLWRLNSYWRFHEKDAGVYLECRAISLTRDIPLGLGWMIEPIIRSLPRESLINTLEATRRALA